MVKLKYVLFLTTVSFATFTDTAGETTEDTYNNILFYNGATAANFLSYNLYTAENVVDDPSFDRKKHLAIFTHGWMQNPTDPLLQILITSYISNGNYNLLFLDWSKAASSFNIALVRTKIPVLGVALGTFLNKILTKGVKIENVHLIGHSFGACISSGAGVFVQQTTSKKLPRITGLDPANLYMPTLQKTDATFVDIIHTNPGVMGSGLNLGTVDFYPNMYGMLQPGCFPFPLTTTNLACSHNRAIDLFSESVKNNNNHNFLSTNVINPLAPKIQMGNNCPTTATGVYKLTTNADSIYSKS